MLIHEASTPFQKTRERSGNQCEAMVQVSSKGVLWSRCWSRPVEVHHMLTRSRGGLILDAIGETAHLIALCPQHHRYAHGPDGHEAGLMINGYVTTRPDGRIVYEGSDPRLAHLALDVSVLREGVCSDYSG